MKRRTRCQFAVNHAHHNAAFRHALAIFKPRRSDIAYHNSLPISFCAELETENQKYKAYATISDIIGFRLSMEIKEYRHGSGFYDILQIHKPHRLLKKRLPEYRAALHNYQRSTQHPLTFRSFNLLLAALSHDLTLTQGTTSSLAEN